MINQDFGKVVFEAVDFVFTNKWNQGKKLRFVFYKRNLLNCTPSHPRALLIINTSLTHLRALPIVDLCLRVYTPWPLSIGALRAFVLPWVVLLQLKGKICFLCSLQLTIHFSFLLFHHIKLSYFFFYFKPLVTPLFMQLFCSNI